jgi:hypothetical protein
VSTAPNGPQLALLIIGAVFFLNLAVWIVIVLVIRKRATEQAAAFRKELEATGEQIVFGPEPATYAGATGGFSTVRGTGILTLTQKRLVFHKAIGKPIEIQRIDIMAVRVSKEFLRRIRGNTQHLIVKVRGGAEVGFTSRDLEGWLKLLKG